MKRAQKYFLLLILVLSASALACFQTSKPALVFSPDTLPDAEAGVPYEVIIQISQNETPVGGFQISEGGLPNGLAYEYVEGEDTARIYGVVRESGTYKFKISVWCYGTNTSGQDGEKEYILEVK
ncbi:MAG: hypothetical protein HZB50_04505 [Chloroflexi bacterium]|nr:hypothetical protein [Chloroflexota bacterium]